MEEGSVAETTRTANDDPAAEKADMRRWEARSTRTKVKRLFWNTKQDRFNTFWRLTLQLVILVYFLAFLSVPFSMIAGLVVMVWQGLSPQELWTAFVNQAVFDYLGIRAAGKLVVTLAVVGSVWLAARVLDRRRFVDFGLHLNQDWWMDFGFGLALGALLMTILFLVEWAAGWVTPTGTLYTPSGGGPIVLMIPVYLYASSCVAIYEELLARGYQLKNMAEGFAGLGRIGPKGGIMISVLVSSLIFVLMHVATPDVNPIGVLHIFLAGALLALGYILTGELAIPIGLHITWNFFQENVFGFDATTDLPSLITIQQAGDTLITGGDLGPQSGLIGLGAVLLGGIAIVLWVRARRGCFGLHEQLATPQLLPG
jgi:membrane protease YdiL (CAAX protease family)